MSALNDAARKAIEGGHLGHLVTINPDGSPQLSAVLVGLEDDEIVAGHLGVYQKVRNIRRDPRVVLSMEPGGMDARGFAHVLVAHGTARITEGGAPELLERLTHRYYGDVPFPDTSTMPAGYVTRIRVDRIAGVGPWVE
ncbi:MAG: TIGR03618 family F420-dependent PPOX class oxidoreductase [Acidimicrobiia bacterium]|nr:TIGR03618 family F420-dependent PPOX class oxidoreductase [Acidimicrobiia bacterium]